MNTIKIDNLVTTVKKAITIEREFADIYRLSTEYCEEFNICSIGELNTVVVEMTTLLRVASLFPTTTKNCIRIAIYNEALKEFINNTPMKAGIITEAIKLTEQVDHLFVIVNDNDEPIPEPKYALKQYRHTLIPK